MAIEPIKGFYVHDEETNTDGVAKYDAGFLGNLDETVSLAGYAPDAKAVGDRLTATEETANHADELATTLNDGGLELKGSVITGQVDTWLDNHPEATTTVLDGAITRRKLSIDVLDEINFTQSIYRTGGLDAVFSSSTLSAYTGNRYTVSNTIDITDYDVAEQYKVISNCFFNLETDFLTFGTSSRQLPTFINCIFWGNGNSVVSSGKYIATSKFINCIFYNCSLSRNAEYVQSARFECCRFAGSVDVITTKNCGDIVFSNCQGEGDFRASLVVADAQDSNNPNCIDHLRLTNCVFEGNPLKTLIIGNKNCEIEIDGCYFEAYPNGVLSLTYSTGYSLCVINVTNTKSYECGEPMYYIDDTYRNIDVHISFDSCRFQNATAKKLLNREDFDDFYVTNCLAENMSYKETKPVISSSIVFDENIRAEVELEPNTFYLVTQERKTYTGIIIYAVVTDATGFFAEKIVDNNNRWTITNDGTLLLKIQSDAHGGGRIIKLS